MQISSLGQIVLSLIAILTIFVTIVITKTDQARNYLNKPYAVITILFIISTILFLRWRKGRIKKSYN